MPQLGDVMQRGEQWANFFVESREISEFDEVFVDLRVEEEFGPFWEILHLCTDNIIRLIHEINKKK